MTYGPDMLVLYGMLQIGVSTKPPVLILHSERDERVPVSQALAFHRACLHHDIPCQMVIYPREPHMMR